MNSASEIMEDRGKQTYFLQEEQDPRGGKAARRSTPTGFALRLQRIRRSYHPDNFGRSFAPLTARLVPPSRALIQDGPEPTNDECYPRNWTEGHKWTTYATICLFTFFANVNASCFTIAVLPLASYFRTPVQRVTWLTNFNVLMFGLGNLLWVPMMRATGKRPVFLLAIVVLIAANAWSARAQSWGSLLAARMVSGTGAAAADAIVPAVARDLWPRSKAAKRLMWFHFALVSGIFLGPLFNAWVVQEHGWRWIPGWIAIAFGVVLILAICFIHETTYHGPLEVAKTSHRPYKAWLGLRMGQTTENFGTIAIKTFKDLIAVATYVPVLFAAALVGLFVGWTIIIQITAAQQFTKPLYNWQIGYVGLFHISAWLGSLPAIFFGGALVDWIASNRRKSTTPFADHADEATTHVIVMDSPKSRLFALLLPLLIGPAGLLIYGLLMAERKPWYGPAIGYALHSFGFNAAGNIAITYAAECAGSYSAEAMVTLFVIRNVIAMFCSFYCNQWISRNGEATVFIIMAILEWVVMLLGVPIYVFHEQIMAWTKKTGPALGAQNAGDRE